MANRRYGRRAGQQVKKEMHKLKRGTLKAGRSNKKVTSRKQAIAIGLSEARRKGAKVPSKSRKSSKTKSSKRATSSRKRSSRSRSRSRSR